MRDLVTWVRAQWDRAGGIALLVAGAVLLVTGCVGVSGTSDGAEQLSYLVSGGLGGLFCLGVGATLMVSAAFQDEWRKLDELCRTIREHQEPADNLNGNGTSRLIERTTAVPVPPGVAPSRPGPPGR
ncbi:MAG: hypothetical protein ACRD0O_00380 [Acidimicrobiia bacterium]